MAEGIEAGRPEVRLTRRSAIGAMAASAVPAGGRAQGFPSRTLRIVVANAPGGSAEAAVRVLQAALQQSLGQGVFVEFRPAADELVAASPADGHTLLIATLADAIAPLLRSKATLRRPEDFASISLMITAPQLLIAAPGFAPRTIAELVALARTQPGRLAYAATGKASTQHLAAALFRMRTGIEAQHIVYKGDGQALIDIAAGHVPFGFAGMGAAWPHARAGRVRALAVTGARRSPAAPDVPTLAESGVADCEISDWTALLAPSGTPREVIERLHREAARIFAEPELRLMMANLGAETIGSTPTDLTAFLKAESARWTDILKTANIKAD